METNTPEHDIIATPLKSSTVTAKAVLTNVIFEESELIKIINIEEQDVTGRVLMAGSNYGTVKRKDYVIKVKERKSNRGRKVKKITKPKRKQQGDGTHFNSQILISIKPSEQIINDIDEINKDTFESKTNHRKGADKIYKIKVFRNGECVVTGGLFEDLHDVYDVFEVLLKFFRKCLNLGDEIQLTNVRANMRNYKAKIINKDNPLRLKLKMIKDSLENDKKLFDKENLTIAEKEHLTKRFHDLKLKSYSLKEKYPGLLVYFSTPTKEKSDKKTTIKIFGSGKFNIDGVVDPESSKLFYNWVIDYIKSDINKHCLNMNLTGSSSESESESEIEFESDK